MAKEKRADGLLYSILQNTLQRYNTPHSIWHLLAFSIQKICKKLPTNSYHSTNYNRKNIFQNFPLFVRTESQLAGRDARRVRPPQAECPVGILQANHVCIQDARTASLPAKWTSLTQNVTCDKFASSSISISAGSNYDEASITAKWNTSQKSSATAPPSHYRLQITVILFCYLPPLLHKHKKFYYILNI